MRSRLYDTAQRRPPGALSVPESPGNAWRAAISVADKIVVGWREWVALPDLGLRQLKAKVDTGARTSALHAFMVEKFRSQGRWRVYFGIHPVHKDNAIEQFCVADLADERWVSDSGGHRERRVVIYTRVVLGDLTWPIYITLANRDNMSFRMLLGRSALRRRAVVNTARSYLMGRPRAAALEEAP